MSSEMQGRSGFVDVAGVRLYVDSWGKAEAPAVLCLHGLGGGTHFFGALGQALARHCRTIAIDLPGSGLSPLTAGTFSYDTAADLIVQLATDERIGVNGQRVCLLGHSMGAFLALEVIRRAPALASSFIVVGGLPEPPAGARTRILDRVQKIRRDGIAGVGAEVVAANFSRRSQTERPELTATFAKLFDRQDPDAYVATAEALAAWTARDLPPLDAVKCLVITGEEDRYAAPDAVRAFARTLPAGTRVEIMRDCGHLPFLEQPAAFAAILSSFLNVSERAAR